MVPEVSVTIDMWLWVDNRKSGAAALQRTGAYRASRYVFDPERISGSESVTHMWTGQQLLHDVAVVNLSAAAQPLLLRVELLVVLNLKQTHEVSLTPPQKQSASWEA